jgi:hypothetical protein
MVRLGEIGIVGSSRRRFDILLPSQPKKVALNGFKDILER